ncbi:MAG: HEAT repeat domain-containing protein [Clostridiales bacterium]|nr:HEAT repeat domain-containing protein [Clostridiales bacterium]
MLFGSKSDKIAKAIEKKNAAGIIKYLNDKDAGVVMQAVAALGKVQGDDSYNTLVSLLRSPKAEIRAAAVTALTELGDPKAQAHVSHMETTEKDAVVLEAVKKALSKLHDKE